MIQRIALALGKLSDLLDIGDSSLIQGWSTSETFMDDDAIAALDEIYQSLLMPEVDSEIFSILESDGIDCTALFHGVEPDDTTTRATLFELAAAAFLIKADRINASLMHLPNIPISSRRQSAPGIDIMAVYVDPTNTSSKTLADGERLVICSVKHTINDAGDLRRKLVESVSTNALTMPYLASQFRVMHHRLFESGINAGRFLQCIRNFPDPDLVRVIAVAGIDKSMREEFLSQRIRLPEIVAADQHYRCISVVDIEHLHERVEHV